MIEALFISLISLIQSPDKYHLATVRMIGFASLKFEGKALYINREDYDHAITKNAVWLDVELTDSVRKLDKTYVLVEGVFDKDKQGHLRMYSGTIKNIKRLEEWKGDPKSGSAETPSP